MRHAQTCSHRCVCTWFACLHYKLERAAIEPKHYIYMRRHTMYWSRRIVWCAISLPAKNVTKSLCRNPLLKPKPIIILRSFVVQLFWHYIRASKSITCRNDHAVSTQSESDAALLFPFLSSGKSCHSIFVGIKYLWSTSCQLENETLNFCRKLESIKC